MSPKMRGEKWGRCAQCTCTWSPNKLWRSNSIFKIWFNQCGSLFNRNSALQGITSTKRCRLSLLTNSALDESKCGGGVQGWGQWVLLYTWSPNKTSNSIFNIWFNQCEFLLNRNRALKKRTSLYSIVTQFTRNMWFCTVQMFLNAFCKQVCSRSALEILSIT
jgi:hypothetical protein